MSCLFLASSSRFGAFLGFVALFFGGTFFWHVVPIFLVFARSAYLVSLKLSSVYRFHFSGFPQVWLRIFARIVPVIFHFLSLVGFMGDNCFFFFGSPAPSLDIFLQRFHGVAHHTSVFVSTHNFSTGKLRFSCQVRDSLGLFIKRSPNEGGVLSRRTGNACEAHLFFGATSRCSKAGSLSYYVVILHFTLRPTQLRALGTSAKGRRREENASGSLGAQSPIGGPPPPALGDWSSLGIMVSDIGEQYFHSFSSMGFSNSLI